MSGYGQIQQAWVAKYNNGISNGNHQALKATLDSSGNIYVLGVSQNANTNTGYVTLKYSPNGVQMWAARMDTTNFSNASPTAFALDSSNDVVVTGTSGTVKYNAQGNLLWTAPYNGSSVAVDGSGNIITDTSANAVSTATTNNFTTVKLSPAGSNLWSATFNGQGYPNIAQRIITDAVGNAYVSGSEIVLKFPSGPDNIYTGPVTVKYDTNGDFVWATPAENEGGSFTQVEGCALDNQGNVNVVSDTFGVIGQRYVTQQFIGSSSNRWTDDLRGGDLASIAHDLKVDNANNVIVTGFTAQNYPSFTYGTFKLDTNGNTIWTNFYPANPTSVSEGNALGVDIANNIYVTGYSPLTATSNDIVTIKYSPNGNQIWLQRYHGPGNGDDEGNAIAVDNNGNVYVAGYETETNGFTEMVLIKYSPVTMQKQSNGNFILQAYGSPGENFDIQASTNLQTWQDLGHVIADTNGFAQFADTNASNFNARFYYTVPQ
jgi:hypothetical protein